MGLYYYVGDSNPHQFPGDDEEVGGVFQKKPVSIIRKEEPSTVKINLKYQNEKPVKGDLGKHICCIVI